MSFFLMSWSCESIDGQILSALMNDDTKELSSLLETYPEGLRECYKINNSEYNLLAIAIKHDREKCFNLLIDNKFSLEAKCKNKTALMYATKYGRLEMTKILLKQGAKINTENSNKENALDYAKKYNQLETQNYLESLQN